MIAERQGVSGGGNPFFIFPILLIYSIIVTVAIGISCIHPSSGGGADRLVTGGRPVRCEVDRRLRHA